MKGTIPDLDFEVDGDLVNLEQDAGCGDVDRVTLHRTQVQHLAQCMGLVRKLSASDVDAGPTAPPTLAEMVRDLDRMKRNLLRVRCYALNLQHEFRTGADWAHADLSHEMNRINGLVDLLDMAVDDFADDYVASDPEPVHAKPTPETRQLEMAL